MHETIRNKPHLFPELGPTGCDAEIVWLIQLWRCHHLVATTIAESVHMPSDRADLFYSAANNLVGYRSLKELKETFSERATEPGGQIAVRLQQHVKSALFRHNIPPSSHHHG